MAKRLVVFITSLMVLVFIASCSPVESEPRPSSGGCLPGAQVVAKTGLGEPEPIDDFKSKIESVEPGPNEVEPADVERDDVTLVEPEPNAPEPSDVEPVEVAVAEPEPNEAEPASVEPNEPEQPQAELDEAAVAEPEPNVVEPASVEPNNVEPNDLKLKTAALFHGKCAEVLKTFVDNKGMVDYKTLRRKRLSLKALLGEFDDLDPNEYQTWPKEDKIAFWLNAYNIQMMKIIADNYPIKSSRYLRVLPGWGPKSILHIKGMWTNYKFLVMDEEFTLSEIDKRFFRKEFDDPRIFFAISNASLSSPPLRNEPYYGHKLNEQLEDQVKRFLSGPLSLRIDKEKGRIYLSSLFQSSSYGKEFISKFAIDKKFKDHSPTTRAVLNFITNYVSEDKVSFLEVGNYSVKFMKYDWTINDGS